MEEVEIRLKEVEKKLIDELNIPGKVDYYAKNPRKGVHSKLSSWLSEF